MSRKIPVSTSLPPEVIESLEDEARKTGKSVSEIIRIAVINRQKENHSPVGQSKKEGG